MVFNYRDKKWLDYQYNVLGKFQSEIGQEEGVSAKTICIWMQKLGIKARAKHFMRGWKIDFYGYFMFFKPDHPSSNSNGYIKRARYNMEKHIGRYLSREELVHHKDMNRLNDNIENLQIMTRSEHNILHEKIKKMLNNLENSTLDLFI